MTSPFNFLSRTVAALAVVFALLTLGGCSGAHESLADTGDAEPETAIAVTSEAPKKPQVEEPSAEATDSAAPSPSESESKAEIPAAQPLAPTAADFATIEPLSYRDIAEYTGNPYTYVNGGEPTFTNMERTAAIGTEYYSDLDEQGRCALTFAVVGPETKPTEERGSIGNVKPSGWQMAKYDFVDGKYLFNRCHLLGYQLTGENANVNNLITGTRYLNIEGMLPFENAVADYVDATGNHVLMRVTPIFEEPELVARGVHMMAESVEDDGAGVSFNVFCYNVQPGVVINYGTGESMVEEEATPLPFVKGAEDGDNGEDAASSSSASGSTSGDSEKGYTDASESKGVSEYVLNTNTKKFHVPSCSSVGQMKDKNRQDVTDTRENIIAQGYDPCKRCNP